MEDEFEPLFEYSRVQPVDFISLDDDDSPMFIQQKRRINTGEGKKNGDGVNVVVSCDDREDDEQQWLPPPPKHLDYCSMTSVEDSTLKALRLKRLELASLAESADDVARAVEESVQKELSASFLFSPDAKKPLEHPSERKKIVISIQDKDGINQFRVYEDDKFERLFKTYAGRVKVDATNLVFCFDGARISPTSTPDSLGLEDNDIIEVHVKLI